MNTRRKLLIGLSLGTLAPALPSWAQQPAQVRRIGFLASGLRPSSVETGSIGQFARGMRKLDYVEGRDFAIEWRFAEGNAERFPQLAKELVQLKVDAMVVATNRGVLAAQKATTTIPIVMVAVSDPVSEGMVASLARPGGNITGLTNISLDVSVKYVELLRAATPKLSNIAVLVDLSQSSGPLFWNRIDLAAKATGMKLTPVEATTESRIEPAIRAAARARAGAIIVVPNFFASAHAPRIAELAVKYRLPTMFWTREHVATGGLMSYGQDNAEHYFRAASYVDRILKGVKPEDLPVEQPMKLQLVINRKTAKALGLALSQELLLRTDEVIE